MANSSAVRVHRPRDDEYTTTQILAQTIQKTSVQTRQFAEEKGLMLVELAERMGISKSHLSQIMSRESATARQIEQIAEALDISPWRFDGYHLLTFGERVNAGDEAALFVARTLIESKKKSKHDKVIKALRKLVAQ